MSEIKHFLSCVDIGKAEVFGKGYIIDEMLYQMSEKFKERKERKRFVSYVCKSLQLIPQGKYLTEDIFTMFNGNPKKEKSAEEIVKDVVARAGLVRVLEDGNKDS